MGLLARRSSALRLLIVEADATCRRVLRTSLESRIARPLMIMETAEVDTARAMTSDQAFDVVVMDIGTIGGAGVFADIIARLPSATVYAMGDSTDVAAAVASVKAGAADYIEKPLDGLAFARRIERQFTETEIAGSGRFEGLVACSHAMRELVAQIERMAQAPAPVFIFGETGTGKSLVARALHERSRRRNAAFISVDCHTVDDQCFADMLTGNGGALDRAIGGTLYLDEVTDLSDRAQSLLLRFLDGGDFQRTEGRRPVTTRVIASSKYPPANMGGSGGLRADLYFRLNVLNLTVPPLRSRQDDLALLVEDFCRMGPRAHERRSRHWQPDAVARLADHDWPGNIRELRSFVDRVSATVVNQQVTAAAIETFLPAPISKASNDPTVTIRPLWMEEERIIEAAIEAFDGNIAKAAAALEISPSTIYRKRRPATEQQIRIA